VGVGNIGKFHEVKDKP